MIEPIPDPLQISHFQERLKSQLEGAIAQQVEYDWPSLLRELFQGKLLAWLIDDKASAITQVVTHPLCKTCTVIFCGGDDLGNWQDRFEQALVSYAKQMGCKYMHIFGRPGWEKIYPEFNRVGVILRREL